MNLKNKTIVITGASSGLGLVLARVFRKKGCNVVASSDNKIKLREVSEETGATTFAADVTDKKAVISLAKFTVKKFGRPDIWINNAGITASPKYPDLARFDEKTAHRVMDVNFFGTFYGSFAALEAMKKKKGAIIINIVSVRALKEHTRIGTYSASKWAARGLTEALKVFAKPIFVMGVYPGPMQTNLWGKNEPKNYEDYMTPEYAADKIVRNLELKNPKSDLVVMKK